MMCKKVDNIENCRKDNDGYLLNSNCEGDNNAKEDDDISESNGE